MHLLRIFLTRHRAGAVLIKLSAEKGLCFLFVYFIGNLLHGPNYT